MYQLNAAKLAVNAPVCVCLKAEETVASVIDEYHRHDHRRSGVEAAATTGTAGTRSSRSSNAGIWDDTDWYAVADAELAEAIRLEDSLNTNTAKNVIMFIGDGMGVSTFSMARLYHAETRNLSQEKIYLSWERLPHVGLSRVRVIFDNLLNFVE